MKPVPYGIVGDGRMARHLTRYLELLGIASLAWSRRSGRPLSDLAACETVLLLVRDDAIESVSREPVFAGKRLIHFSGSVVLPHVAGIHPLMTFGRELYGLEVYGSIAFVTEAGRERFEDVFPGLPNRAFAIEPSERPLYHALCVLGGNFPQLLARKMMTELSERYGIPEGASLAYVRQAFANFVSDPQGSLTGPIARGDKATIEANLSALERAGDRYAQVYGAIKGASS